MVGSCLGLTLARRGARVTLIDHDLPGKGCSSGNAGIIATDSIFPIASPTTLALLPLMLLQSNSPLRLDPKAIPQLSPWLLKFVAASTPGAFKRGTSALSSLTGGALKAWNELLADNPGALFQKQGGWLELYGSKWSWLMHKKMHRLQRAHGIKVTDLDPLALQKLAGAAGPDICYGVHFPRPNWFSNPHEVVKALVNEVLERGGVVINRRVFSITGGDHSACVHTDDHTYRADRVVIATGADSALFTRQLGDPIPLTSERGYHIMLPDPGIELTLPLMFADYKVVATPMSEGLRLAGTSELTTPEAPPTPHRIDSLVKLAPKLLPGVNLNGYQEWMGRRPTLPDSLPVIGQAQQHPAVWYAFGHQHIGITLAAITAKLLTQAIFEEEPDIDLAPFGPQRFNSAFKSTAVLNRR